MNKLIKISKNRSDIDLHTEGGIITVNPLHIKFNDGIIHHDPSLGTREGAKRIYKSDQSDAKKIIDDAVLDKFDISRFMV